MSYPESLTDRELDREISLLTKKLHQFQLEREKRGKKSEIARDCTTGARSSRKNERRAQAFVPGDVVEITNHRNGEFGTKGVVNYVSKGNRFVYFTTPGGVTFFRGPNNLKLVQAVEKDNFRCE